MSDAVGANLLMQLIPIHWDGPARKKGDWLPRWDDVYLSLDGVMLRVFESRGRFLEVLELEQEQQQQQLQDSAAKPVVIDKKHCYTVTAVDKENVGRPHGFHVKTKEKSKPLHLVVDSELERVL
ncbi:CMGC/MAPK protein kinase [Phytophthora cinnamomi]|uniref:CMGC/MAPK protein kinase n=1 Tax=Phytophthora cinnamomi TaxID=4785 RepID=UPI00355A093B|nr:CMGC/MAPK protein kinase [Phytophthora cinnamomi]